MFTPDRFALRASHSARLGNHSLAFFNSVMSVRARAEWVLINGRWHRRANIMRKD